MHIARDPRRQSASLRRPGRASGAGFGPSREARAAIGATGPCRCQPRTRTGSACAGQGWCSRSLQIRSVTHGIKFKFFTKLKIFTKIRFFSNFNITIKLKFLI